MTSDENTFRRYREVFGVSNIFIVRSQIALTNFTDWNSGTFSLTSQSAKGIALKAHQLGFNPQVSLKIKRRWNEQIVQEFI
jgi:hypothetical protein